MRSKLLLDHDKENFSTQNFNRHTCSLMSLIPVEMFSGDFSLTNGIEGKVLEWYKQYSLGRLFEATE